MALDLHLAEIIAEAVPGEEAMNLYDDGRNGLRTVDASLKDDTNQCRSS